MHIDPEKLIIALKKRNIEQKMIDSLVEEAANENMTLYEILTKKGVLPDEVLGRIISDIIEIPYVNLSKIQIENDVLGIIPEKIALKQGVISFEINEELGRIKVAMTDPFDLEMINDIQKKTGHEVQVYFTTQQGVKAIIGKYHQELKRVFLDLLPREIKKEVGNNKKKRKGPLPEQELPIVMIFDSIILHAYRQHASDIHIEATKEKTIIRFRIDGILHQVVSYPKKIHEPLIARCKILAGLRIDETRAAQDGRIAMQLDSDNVALRVSILPTHFGEKVVMRILVDIKDSVDLMDSGMNKKTYDTIIRNAAKPYGMMIVTGPTGSGKTTTLYNIIKLLNSEQINISTIEDPIEYGIEGINQVQVNHATNLTFASGLRALLRQDPDSVLVGEIRDKETAQIAIESAMTGHMVFTTLHANSTSVGIPRLTEMGMEPFLLTAAINCMIAQRLVRKLCTHCIQTQLYTRDSLSLIYRERNMVEMVERLLSENLDESTQPMLEKQKGFTFYTSSGCKACGFTGYKGRLGIYEVMELGNELKNAIIQLKTADEIETVAVNSGMKTMLEEGMTKALSGETSLEEIIRVIKN